MMVYRAAGKRFMDVILSAFGLLSLSPIFAMTSLAVRRNLGAPVFFTQIRPGLHGRGFKLIKFRSMKNVTDNDGREVPDELRLSTFGQRLRASSLDELPELWNVLRGDMSLVGPRPLLAEYLSLYSDEQARRHEVRPGITGWAQVNGRNAVSWQERLEMDVWYVDNYSFRVDIGILFATVKSVLRREGIAAEGSVTMPPFEG